jgi:ATP-binding cassette, subfamily B, bacterial
MFPEPLARKLLRGPERFVSLLRVDLNERLEFSDSYLVRTNLRMLGVSTSGELLWEMAHSEIAHFRLEERGRVVCLGLESSLTSRRIWLSPRQFGEGRKFWALALAPAGDSDLDEATPDGERVDAHAVEVKAAPRRSPLVRLFRFARPYRKRLMLGLACTVLGTLAGLVPPYLTMPLMDDVLIPFQEGRPIELDAVLGYLGGLLFFALVAWALVWARTYVLALVSERIGADLRTTAFEHLLKLPLDFYGGKRTGDLMTRIGSETDRICTFLSLHALDFITDVLVIVMTGVILFSIDPALALATLLPLPLIAWLIHAVRDRLTNGFSRLTRVWAEVTNVLSDAIPGIRVVKAFGQEDREAQRFRDANRFNLVQNDRLNRIWSLFSPTVTLLTEVGLLCVWGFGIYRVAGHKVTVGVLTAFIAYISRFYSRLDSMSRIVSVTQKAAVAAERLFDILDRPAGLPEPSHPKVLDTVEGRITLKSVGFRYGTRQVLRDLNLDIRPGEMIGLVGESGAGKSTLANLLCRFHDVTEGAILIDGVDVRELALTHFARTLVLFCRSPCYFLARLPKTLLTVDRRLESTKLSWRRGRRTLTSSS